MRAVKRMGLILLNIPRGFLFNSAPLSCPGQFLTALADRALCSGKRFTGEKECRGIRHDTTHRDSLLPHLLPTVTLPPMASHSLTRYWDKFISSLIEKGRYGNKSEVLRAGLRLLEKECDASREAASWSVTKDARAIRRPSRSSTPQKRPAVGSSLPQAQSRAQQSSPERYSLAAGSTRVPSTRSKSSR